MVNFPTPIGGNITNDDIVPSAIFLALHALLLPAIAWNYFKRHQWSVVSIGSTIFAVERVALYSLRFYQAYDATWRTNTAILSYQQATIGYNFVGLIPELLSMYRCLVVETTLPDAEAGHPNLKRRRFWFRRFMDVVATCSIPISVVGVVMNVRYRRAMEDQSRADILWNTRLGTTIAAIVLHQIAIASVAYGLFKVSRIRRRSCAYILSMFLLLEIFLIHRIIIIQHTETSLTATGPGTLTSKGEKAAFYVLQSTIELCILAFMLVSPMRRLYGVGRWGDPPTDHSLNKQLKKEEQLASTTQLAPADRDEVKSA